MRDLHKLMLSVLVAASTVFALPISAFAFFDDFQDQDVNGWLPTTTGGRGACGVEFHSVSLMASCNQYGSGQNALSMDFTYSAADLLSFDMQAVTQSMIGSTGRLDARAGVEVSFLTQFNSSVGAVGLYNVTDPSFLPANAVAIDGVQHNYGGTMAYFASQAGLGPLDPAYSSIAKIRVNFLATAVSDGGPKFGVAIVWFDNVRAGPVPEPYTSTLALIGLAMVSVAARRRRSES